jgi:NitT/TauT family transport system permease protein
MKRVIGVAAPTLFVALLLIGWEIACRLLDVPSYFLPTPSAIVLALVRNAPLLFVSAWLTLSTALIAFAITGLLASLAALGAAASRIAEASFRPIAIALQVTPIIAIAPLFSVWAGIDHPGRAVVALACVAAFFPMYSGALAGLSAADPELERLFDLYEATGWQRLTRLKLPSAVPQALEGFKVGLGLALVGAVIGEMVAGSGSEQGLAWRIQEASHRMEMDRSFAAVVALALMAGVLHAAFQALERRLIHWWRGR